MATPEEAVTSKVDTLVEVTLVEVTLDAVVILEGFTTVDLGLTILRIIGPTGFTAPLIMVSMTMPNRTMKITMPSRCQGQ